MSATILLSAYPGRALPGGRRPGLRLVDPGRHGGGVTTRRAIASRDDFSAKEAFRFVRCSNTLLRRSADALRMPSLGVSSLDSRPPPGGLLFSNSAPKRHIGGSRGPPAPSAAWERRPRRWGAREIKQTRTASRRPGAQGSSPALRALARPRRRLAEESGSSEQSEDGKEGPR
jgi:hypothetical protein